MEVLLLNGPNLNLLGVREPHVYGSTSLADIETKFIQLAHALGVKATCIQSNHEGVLIEHLHAFGLQHLAGKPVGVVFNPGAYTHTSIAIHDAIQATGLPVIEVHISNVYARESFRHHSFISPVAKGSISGLGVDGYYIALDFLLSQWKSDERY